MQHGAIKSDVNAIGQNSFGMVGAMLRKPDFSALQGKSLNEVANHAENLAKGELEDRLIAHAIFASILEQLPASEDQGVAQANMA